MLGLYLGILGTLLVVWGVAEIVNEEARASGRGAAPHDRLDRPVAGDRDPSVPGCLMTATLRFLGAAGP